MVVVHCERYECIPMCGVNACGIHHTKQHVFPELHGWCCGFRILVGCVSLITFGFACFLWGFFLEAGQIIGFNLVTEVNPVEPVEGFGVNFAAAFDVKGNLEALALLDLWNMPNDVKSTFAVFGGHGDVVSLPVLVLHFPILDLKLWWENIVDVEVAQGRVAVVLEENQDFVSSLSTQRDGLLAGTEIATVVHHLNRRCLDGLSRADGAESLCAELNSSRCVDAFVARRGIGCGQWIGDFDGLLGLEAEGATCPDREGHGVTLTVR